MATTAVTQERANGLATYFSILWAPRAAFEQLARVPTWGWAAVAGIVLLLIASFIVMPETIKVSQIAQAQQLSQMPADQRAIAQQNMQTATKFTPFFIVGGVIVGTWIVWLITTIFFTIGGALSGATAKFGMAWVLAVNVSVVWFVATLVNDVIVRLRGPDAVNSPGDLYALPSLSAFVHGSPKLVAFLNGFNIGNLWYYIVAIIGLEVAMRMKRAAAIITIVVLAVLLSALGAAFAH